MPKSTKCTRKRRVRQPLTHHSRRRGGGWLSACGKRITRTLTEGRPALTKNDYTDERLVHERVVVAHTTKPLYLHIQLPPCSDAEIKKHWRSAQRKEWFASNDRMHSIVNELGSAMQHFHREHKGFWRNSPLYVPLGQYHYNEHQEWYRIDNLSWRFDSEEHGWRRYLTPRAIRKYLFFPALRITWMLAGAGLIQESAEILEMMYELQQAEFSKLCEVKGEFVNLTREQRLRMQTLENGRKENWEVSVEKARETGLQKKWERTV